VDLDGSDAKIAMTILKKEEFKSFENPVPEEQDLI